MEPIDIVESEYLATSVAGGERRRVTGASVFPVDTAVRTTLPTFFKDAIAAMGREADDYRVYGSIGQINWYLAKIPWVAILNRNITTSTEHGYYIVLLFREDMQGCVLSLNQGYTQYLKAFGAVVAKHKVQQGAASALSRLSIPAAFVGGPVELQASGDLGKGYEQGAILSRLYPKNVSLEASQLQSDLGVLLDAYNHLYSTIGPDLLELLPATTEDEFQEAAGSMGMAGPLYEPPPAGPVPIPKKTKRAPRSGYARDPRVSNRAMHDANYTCVVDGGHSTFVSKATRRNYVEAHHLIPMQFQDQFTASLDVVENIVVL